MSKRSRKADEPQSDDAPLVPVFAIVRESPGWRLVVFHVKRSVVEELAEVNDEPDLPQVVVAKLAERAARWMEEGTG